MEVEDQFREFMQQGDQGVDEEPFNDAMADQEMSSPVAEPLVPPSPELSESQQARNREAEIKKDLTYEKLQAVKPAEGYIRFDEAAKSSHGLSKSGAVSLLMDLCILQKEGKAVMHQDTNKLRAHRFDASKMFSATTLEIELK